MGAAPERGYGFSASKGDMVSPSSRRQIRRKGMLYFSAQKEEKFAKTECMHPGEF